eukprot:gb/GECG01010739.1/.p1 GENE.gb/GECG01010739.1/~~gb/GECG01010739.1/.p1  ORF type:complete len:231 (+),score=23.68 gb/GECG01010739.1/:1-693(+)
MAGYGVAGHKNEYTTGVRVGNWCEDALGISEASRHTVERVPFHGETETKAKFAPPWNQPQPKSTGATLDSTLLSEGGGISNDPNKLFRHEHADFKSHDDRFTTTCQAAHSGANVHIQDYCADAQPRQKIPTMNRTVKCKEREKEVTAGLDERDPMRQRNMDGKCRGSVPTSRFATMTQVSQESVDRYARKAAFLGHKPKAQHEKEQENEYRPRKTQFTQSFKCPIPSLRA